MNDHSVAIDRNSKVWEPIPLAKSLEKQKALILKKHDAIIIGAGHNGITNAAFLAKAGLDVLLVEKNEYIGGAPVSRELYKDWKNSNCS